MSRGRVPFSTRSRAYEDGWLSRESLPNESDVSETRRALYIPLVRKVRVRMGHPAFVVERAG